MNLRTLARADTPTGEVALRERTQDGAVVHELIVNGAFAMDSVDVSSELALADCATVAGCDVLIGGLGLGYTAARVLDRGAGRVTVAEQAAVLVEWAEAAMTPTLARVAADPRVSLVPRRIQDVIADDSPGWDVILLDVENGPSFLILADNAGLYESSGLVALWRRLKAGGTLAIWCEAPSPELWQRLCALDDGARELLVPVARDGRTFDYVLYMATKAN